MATVGAIESICLEDLGFSFGPKIKPIFVGLNYEFVKGGAYWIKSTSGGGKSSLLRILAALVTPTAGDLKIDGVGTREMSFEEFLPYRLQIGYSFELGGLISNKTLFENLMLPLQYHKLMAPNEATAWVEKLAEIFEISEHLHSRPSRVSGSIKKATVVARAFVMKPRVLILDEPTIGLSQSRKDALCKLVHDGRESGQFHIVITATDDVTFARKVATKTLEMRSQRIEETEVVQNAFIITHKKASS
ncbi:MAG: ATP-binding cassette domain-containing protein [Bdellovibrionaceae bacterium]|nr:ATP-binding cassette domain-containing protein [Bdellovibrionales bacterium]MCB9083414.1 ATP-binding cassette domain-containing protein [Pseudobdellovibrionaceae bacterium]